ncbi:hypothetical protein AMELA_G00205490, partial [Ameiurus melas]
SRACRDSRKSWEGAVPCAGFSASPLSSSVVVVHVRGGALCERREGERERERERARTVRILT